MTAYQRPRRLARIALLAAASLLAPAGVGAQGGEPLILQGKSQLREGVSAGDPTPILQARALFERARRDPARARQARYYLALADYRLAVLYGQVRRQEEQAVAHAAQAQETLEALVEEAPRDAEAHALLVGVYGQVMALQPSRALLLGPRTNRVLKKARDLAPDNPRVVLQGALRDYHTPRMWGGSTERALEGFRRAATLYRAQPRGDALLPDWGEDEAYAWLGVAYQETGDPAKAREAFQTALQVNPAYRWVRESLLPGVNVP